MWELPGEMAIVDPQGNTFYVQYSVYWMAYVMGNDLEYALLGRDY